MSRLSHEAAEELIAAAALGALDEGDHRDMLEHLQTCPRCTENLVEYRRATMALALSVSVTPIDVARSERIRGRLLARAQADLEPLSITARESTTAVEGAPRQTLVRGRWLGWAVAAGMSSLLLAHHSFHRPLDLGWLVAAALGLLLVCTGVYATSLRGRLSELERRLFRKSE